MTNDLVDIRREGNVALAVLQRPEAMNALNVRFLHRLRSVVAEVAADPDIAGLVITGAGKSFCAGADISEMAGLNAVEATEFATLGQQTMFDIEGLGKPVLAAVNGFCIGGGLEVALACDFIVASTAASFAFPEVNLGIIPGFGGTQRLARLVGKGKTKELVFTGDRIGAEEAFRIGLANRILPADGFVEEAVALMQRICARGSFSLRMAKEVIDAGFDQDLASACLLERNAFALCFGSGDQKEGMTAFLEKRSPVFRRGREKE